MHGPLKSHSVQRLSLAPNEVPEEHTHRPSSDYDALADLFLDDAALAPAKPRIDRPSAPSAPTTPRTRVKADGLDIEAVIVGHLPVLGAAWITQFARQRASQNGGPVALARLMDGVLSIDLVAESSTSLEGAPECVSIDEALLAAAEFTPRWIVRVGEMEEKELADDTHVAGLTLLTGADEAAMVASYRTFKSLWPSGAAEQQQASPAVRVAIFGADAAKAAEAEAKLRRASSTFLGRDLDAAMVVQRVVSCAVATVFRAKTELSVGELTERIAALRTVTTKRVVAPVAPPAPAAVATRTQPEPARAVAPTIEAKPEARAGAELLAPMIEGLIPLTFRCPYCPEIEFATDGAGGLHLLALHDGRNDQPVKDLLATASWAAMHEALLGAASPGLLATHDHGPVLHLISEKPQGLRRLFDSGVRVHLLVRVANTSVCRELN